MPDTATSVDQLARLLDDVEQLIGGVRDDQWTAATPCTEWNVRALVNHLVRGNRLFAAVLRGGQPAPAEPADVLGDDPRAAYRASADAVLEAFRQPGVLERVVTAPFGTAPGRVALHIRNTELLVHGWDLARATDQSTSFPEPLAQQELEFSRGAIGQFGQGRSPFAPPQPVAEDAPAVDRLAALLGRKVTWPE
jgi:uncharacterized protein (TIGR03086 family)